MDLPLVLFILFIQKNNSVTYIWNYGNKYFFIKYVYFYNL